MPAPGSRRHLPRAGWNALQSGPALSTLADVLSSAPRTPLPFGFYDLSLCLWSPGAPATTLASSTSRSSRLQPSPLSPRPSPLDCPPLCCRPAPPLTSLIPKMSAKSRLYTVPFLPQPSSRSCQSAFQSPESSKLPPSPCTAASSNRPLAGSLASHPVPHPIHPQQATRELRKLDLCRALKRLASRPAMGSNF